MVQLKLLKMVVLPIALQLESLQEILDVHKVIIVLKEQLCQSNVQRVHLLKLQVEQKLPLIVKVVKQVITVLNQKQLKDHALEVIIVRKDSLNLSPAITLHITIRKELLVDQPPV
jgi:hypothetical protein